MHSPFWNFSIAFYRRPEVAEACLSCQDEAGADVNLVLLMLWQATRGVRLARADVAAIDAKVAPWRRQVVEPLRAIRRLLKASPALAGGEIFRGKVKALELEAERLLQEALFDALQAEPVVADVMEAARHNLEAYQAAREIKLPSRALETLLTSLAAMPRPDASA